MNRHERERRYETLVELVEDAEKDVQIQQDELRALEIHRDRMVRQLRNFLDVAEATDPEFAHSKR